MRRRSVLWRSVIGLWTAGLVAAALPTTPLLQAQAGEALPVATVTAAGDAPQEFPEYQAITLSAGGMLLRVGLGLVLVMGILVFVLFLYKRATRAGMGPRRDAAIQVLSRCSLGQRTSLAVVCVAGETLLLGVTQHEVRALTRLAPHPPNQRQPALQAKADLSMNAPRPEAAGGERVTGRQDSAVVAELIGELPSADSEQGFERTLESEVKRVRQGLWASIKRLDIPGGEV
ncbi:MAG: FliO/MopB family protein [Candidatus Eisenbacteria sp.]|nr:FliO/MopB family protein [Candidatus Eisenbacteria bacterium]